MTKLKTNPYEILTKKSFDEFLKLLNAFDFKYYNHSDKRLYDKGKKQFDKIKEIFQHNDDFKNIYLIWETYHSVDATELIKKQMIDIRESLN